MGHVIGNGQVKPDPKKIAAVKSYPVPKTKKDVRSFLGLTGYYRRFITNYARLAMPLSDLTKKSLPSAFLRASKALPHSSDHLILSCEFPILQNPDFSKHFLLQTDASDRGVGAVLSQKDESGMDRPIAYYSKKLLPNILQ